MHQLVLSVRKLFLILAALSDDLLLMIHLLLEAEVSLTINNAKYHKAQRFPQHSL